MKIIEYLCVILPVVLAACESVPEPQAGDPPLVVEGWLNEGEAPLVIVTRAVDMADTLGDFADVVEKWCRVTVIEDGEREVTLVARKNGAYMPSFVYTSTRIKGKVGHRYALRVEAYDTVAVAETALLPSARISRLEAEPVSDGRYKVRAWLDGLEPAACYKLYCRSIGKEKHMYPALMGNVSAADYDPEHGVIIGRGIRTSLADEEAEAFSHEFESGETVVVGLYRIAPEVAEFWKVYDANVSLSGNMFFSFAGDCPGNVTGAKGYWSAQGVVEAAIAIP